MKNCGYCGGTWDETKMVDSDGCPAFQNICPVCGMNADSIPPFMSLREFLLLKDPVDREPKRSVFHGDFLSHNVGRMTSSAEDYVERYDDVKDSLEREEEERKHYQALALLNYEAEALIRKAQEIVRALPIPTSATVRSEHPMWKKASGKLTKEFPLLFNTEVEENTTVVTNQNRLRLHVGFGHFAFGPDSGLDVVATDTVRDLADKAEKMGALLYLEVVPEK